MAIKFLNDTDVSGIARTVLEDTPAAGGSRTGLVLAFPTSPYGLVFRSYATGESSIQNQRESNDGELYDLFLNPLGGDVGVGTDGPTQKLHVNGNARVTGAYYDSNNSPGTAGQVLSSTATGTDWVAPTTGDITGVTAGTALTGGGTSGNVTLNVSTAGGAGLSGANIPTSVPNRNYVIQHQDTVNQTLVVNVPWVSGIGEVEGAGTINGLTLTGNISGSGASGSLTLGGTLSIGNADWSGADLSVVNGGTGASTAAAARTNLGVINDTGTPAILSNGSLPSLNTGITALEVRTLIGAGTSSSSGVTSVSTSGTVSGLTLTGGPITGTGTITLGGTLSLTSANVTSALGFTPYNATNPAGYTTNTGTTTASNTQTFTNKSGNISQWTNDSGYITSASLPSVGNGTLTMVTSAGLDGGTQTFTANQAGNTTITLSLDLNELAASGTLVGTDDLVVVDNTTTSKTQISTIPLSIFNNDAGWTSNAGDITGVTAGTGMTGGGTSGTVTLNVIGGTGITANANDIAIDATVLTTTGNQTISGAKRFNGSIIDSSGLSGTSGQVLASTGTGQVDWVDAASGTIGGTAADTRIAFGSAANTLTSDPDFTVVQTTDQERIKIANGGVQVANMNTAPVAALAGSLRYRTDTVGFVSYSYVDMCMQTSSAGYSWVNIVQNSWT